ncbi:MAG TPA: hypothetical protein VJO32_12940 [Ktedonobacteraceae bacterium]|nr:hypothetical protein [Ktedonobacteraceae bacterium]
MDMHRSGQAGEHDTAYFRLRYSTQFTIGGRPHTIEMEIPVPVGASAEQREQLMREAEASIEQLYRQIEKRGSQRTQQSAEVSRPQESARRDRTGYTPAPTPQAAPVEARPATPAPTRQPAQSAPPQQVAAQTPAREASQPIPLQGKAQGADAPVAARPTIGSEMPSTHNLNDPTSGTIKLSEFIRIIRDRWSISPKDVIDLLHLPNLNNMNYRDLLRQLEPLVEQRARVAPKNTTGQPRPATSPVPAPSSPRPSSPASSTTMRDASVRPAPPPTPTPPGNVTNRASAPAPPPSKQLLPKPSAPAEPAALDGPANIPVFPLPGNTLREVPRPYKFDEEDEEAEDAQGGNNTGEDENSMSDALARIKIDDLKDIRGTAAVSPARLIVLHNLLDSQISDTQFQQLIEGLWNINSDKKLKQDHVEALISWAKEDYFDDEVRAVLAVMNG